MPRAGLSLAWDNEPEEAIERDAIAAVQRRAAYGGPCPVREDEFAEHRPPRPTDTARERSSARVDSSRPRRGAPVASPRRRSRLPRPAPEWTDWEERPEVRRRSAESDPVLEAGHEPLDRRAVARAERERWELDRWSTRPAAFVDEDEAEAPLRRTVKIEGRGAERMSPQMARRHAPGLPHERVGMRPDRAALWAVLLGVVLILAAATSSHAAVLSWGSHGSGSGSQGAPVLQLAAPQPLVAAPRAR